MFRIVATPPLREEVPRAQGEAASLLRPRGAGLDGGAMLLVAARTRSRPRSPLGGP
jgi:hypothetical protein